MVEYDGEEYELKSNIHEVEIDVSGCMLQVEFFGDATIFLISSEEVLWSTCIEQ